MQWIVAGLIRGRTVAIRSLRIALLVGVVVGMLIPMAPALAVIPDPDSSILVSGVYAYNDLLEEGDAGFLIDYTIPYASPPTETAQETYLAVFIDSDGITQLRAVAPYVFTDAGYNHGVMWIYFSEEDVTAYGIDSSKQDLYRVWVVGNPTLTWSGDPPKKVATIDYWQPSGTSTPVLFALRILSMANTLELDWSLDMIEATSQGNKLTATGEEYFINVVPNLRTIAPLCFASGTVKPQPEDIDYTTSFGATMTDGTGTVVGSPITFTAGSTTVTVTAPGTFTFVLSKGTQGTMTNGTGTVVGSPVDLVAGTSTVTVTAAGTFTVDLSLNDLATDRGNGVLGTGFDLTAQAAAFGMSRWFFSGIVWMAITIIICANVYRIDASRESYTGGVGKNVMLVFNICIIGGTLLGLLHPVVGALLFIGFGAFTGYVLIFRNASF